MEVEVHGAETRNDAEGVILASQYYAKKLMHGNMHRNIDLTVFLDPKFHLAGCCAWVDRAVRPKEFVIHLRIKPPKTSPHPPHLLQNLAHEMVHLSQMAKGALIDQMDGGKIQFRGRLFHRVLHHPDRDAYWNAPWEIEAYGREYGLFVRWQDEFARNGHKMHTDIEFEEVQDPPE